MTLREQAEKASNKWVKNVRERSGTVPTRPEWLAWIELWMNKHSQANPRDVT